MLQKKQFPLLFLTIISLVCLNSAWASNPLDRDLEAVTLPADQFSDFYQTLIQDIHLCVYDAGTGQWLTVPVQIDDNNGNGLLDAGDEILFMAKDLADQAPDVNAWFDDEPSTDSPRYELDINGPTTASSFGYLYKSNSITTNSNSYISYNAVADQVTGLSYQMGHDMAVASGFPTDLIIPHEGETDVDILNRHRLRISVHADLSAKYSGITVSGSFDEIIKEKMNVNKSLKLKAGFISFSTDIKIKTYNNGLQVVDGPIRIKRISTIRIEIDPGSLGDLIGADKTEVDFPVTFLYYPNHSELWSGRQALNFNLPPEIDLDIKYANFTQSLNSNAIDMEYMNNKMTTAASIPINASTESPYSGFASLLSAEDWPGKLWYGEIARNAASVSDITLFNLLELNGTAIGQSQGFHFDSYDDLDGERSYGNAGIRMDNFDKNAENVLDVRIKNFYFNTTKSHEEMDDLFAKYSTDMSSTITKQTKPDTILPAVITDLAVTPLSNTSVQLTWTAPGDDGIFGGPAAVYYIRYHKDNPELEDKWTWWGKAAENGIYDVTPDEPGTTQTLVVDGLDEADVYYFRMRTRDEETNNWSDLSNVGYSNTLPVELVSFTAQTNQNKILLRWETASETNNLEFNIERSVNNSTWEKIGFISGKGTTVKAQHYSFTDDVKIAGEYSYRLNQIDTDGTGSLSDPINITVEAPNQFTLMQNYPNPFNPSTTIEYQISEEAFIELAIFNTLGKKVKTLVQQQVQPGFYRTEWDGTSDTNIRTSSGVYFYVLTTPNNKIFKKMIKLE